MRQLGALMYSDIDEMDEAIQAGLTLYAIPGLSPGSWDVASDRDAILDRAQLNADALGEEASVFRLASPGDSVYGSSFLFVRRKLKTDSPQVPYLLQWALADTREAAEMLRDVSAGPTPYFAVTIETSCQPAERTKAV